MIDMTPVIIAVIAVVAAIVAYKLVPWINSNTTEKQQDIIDGVYRMLVFAAEQIYGEHRGSEKLTYVITELEKRGFTADLAKIEATVWEYLNSNKIVEVSTEIDVEEEDVVEE